MLYNGYRITGITPFTVYNQINTSNMRENMIKSKSKELNKIKEQVDTVNEKLQELTEEELKKVAGGDSRSSQGLSIMGADSAYISQGMKVVVKE